MATYEEKREKGFIDVYGYGGEWNEMNRYCVGNRLILRGIYENMEEIITTDDRTPVVIKGRLGEGYEHEFWIYQIGLKRDVIVMDGEMNELVDYLIRREREYRREKTKIYRKKKAESGEFAGGYTPYGYYTLKKKLYVDDYESFVVKFVFYRRGMGCSYGGIAKELNLRGFRNRRGKEFLKGSIESIEKNKRFYQGYVTYNGKEIKGSHSPILGIEELIDKAWSNRVFDEATEARITEHRKKFHSENSVPKEIKPYIMYGQEPKKKVRRAR